MGWKSERRIGHQTKAGAAVLPWRETCCVSLAGSTSKADGSCLQMFQKSPAHSSAHSASTAPGGMSRETSQAAAHTNAHEMAGAHCDPAIWRTRDDNAASTTTDAPPPTSTRMTASFDGLPPSRNTVAAMATGSHPAHLGQRLLRRVNVRDRETAHGGVELALREGQRAHVSGESERRGVADQAEHV